MLSEAGTSALALDIRETTTATGEIAKKTC